jgi:hypothetical protein
MNCPYNCDEPESRLEWFEKKLEEREEFIKRTFEDWADDDTRVEKMLEPIIGKEFIDGNSYCVPGTVGCVEEIINKYNELKFLKQLHVSELSLFVEDVKNLKEIINQKLIQRTELLAIAEEMADVIIGNGASVKDALPIDKLDEFYKKWNIGEPFVRDYSA